MDVAKTRPMRNTFRRSQRTGSTRQTIPKTPTGITGLDEITGGGLPKGRPTLICGSAGCGKTLMAMEFIVRGAAQFDEPGVFMTFEESPEELAQNVRSLGFDLNDLVEQGKLALDYVHVERNEIQETGEYDLEGLFIRLGHAIDSIGAKRVVLDTIETLFGGLDNSSILRAELRRLFRWLKDRGVTAVITGERGEGQLTRQGLEEYVSDCVILLDHRVTSQVTTRRLRIVKYRGSIHGTNEYPFLISEEGISVLPITSLGLRHIASAERITSGIQELDEMLGGRGYFKGSTVLVSGTAGVGKTSLAAHLADATCRRGDRCIYFAFEESESQLIRNMRSIGVDLEPHVKSGRLQFHMSRPSLHGLETHLATMHKAIKEFDPHVVIVDPISNLMDVSSASESQSMLVRLIDHLKMHQITAFFTSLNSGGDALEQTNMGVSSLVDTWILLRDIELGGERNRSLYILKSRGMAHSNQLREFVLSEQGVRLLPAYLGPEGVLTGSARLAQESKEKAQEQIREEEMRRKLREIERKRRAVQMRIEELKAEYEAEAAELELLVSQDRGRSQQLMSDRNDMAKSRKATTAIKDEKSRNGRVRK
jgi:circadian clock protein KaiC